jgi:ATP-dependent Clp protease protease subunit
MSGDGATPARGRRRVPVEAHGLAVHAISLGGTLGGDPPTGQLFRRVVHQSPRSVHMSEEDQVETLTALTQPFGAKQLYESRTILIMGEINSMVAERVTAQLLALSGQSRDPIRLFIHSNGGHVESGDTIHDMIKFVQARIIMVGTGWVASAGTHIYLAVPREDRYALPNTRFMIHQPLGGVGGRAADLQIEAEEILKARERLNRTIAEATGQPIARVRKDTDRNFWMSPAEAKEYGIVGTIIASSADLPR